MRLEERILKEKVKGVRRRDLVYYLAKCAIGVAFHLMNYKIIVEGIDQIPEEGPAIIAFHHVLLVDPLLLMYVSGRPVNSPGKKELFEIEIPLWRRLITACGAYQIDRFNQDREMNEIALAYSAALLELDEMVSLAPEATRSRDKIGKLRPAIIRILEDRIFSEKNVSCPIIACGIHYSDNTREIPKLGSKISLRFSEYNIWERGKLKSKNVIVEELGQLLSKLSGYPYDLKYDPLEEKYSDLMN